ncbi:MAG: transporter substrate-binding domain-containing protein [Deltaproteobacteria bacterium]|nr:transporter substrate-binding domain-containing protein [Deltaproteobacteria bacterium]
MTPMNANVRQSYARIMAVAFVVLFTVVTAVCGTAPEAANAAQSNRSPISSASEIDYPPFCIVDEYGRANGFSVELLRAALAAMGRDVTFRTGLWAEVRGWLERGDVDALPLVGRTPEREAHFDFTFPYMSLHGAIVVRKDEQNIRDLKDLRGKSVAVMQGDNAEEFMRREDRGIEIHSTATFEQALRELSEGRYDAVVIQRLVAIRLIKENNFENLLIVDRPVEGFRQDFCFAVREGDRDTLALLNEGLALVMADGTYRHLHAKWFAALELPSDRPIIIGGDRNYPPYEYLDENGRPAGFTVEITQAIARKMNLNILIRLGPRPEIVKGMEDGEIDAIQGMFYSPERDMKFDFSQPYLVSHYVGVTRRGEGDPPARIEDLEDKRIVVQQGDVVYDYLVEKGLGDQVALVDTQEDVLRELSEGMHDCGIAVRISSLYLMEKNGWTNLVLGRAPFLSMEYCYAVPDNRGALLAQFTEGLKVLEKSGEYRRIHEKWLGVYREPVSFADFLRYFATFIILFLLILVVAVLWVWTLRRQVAIRTKELSESEERFRIIFMTARDAIIMMDGGGTVAFWNPSAERIFGYAAGEIIGKDVHETLAVEKYRKAYERGLKEFRKTGRGMAIGNTLELESIRKDGSIFPIELSLSAFRIGGEWWAVGIARDITERKHAEKVMRESEELHRTMIASSPVALYMLDMGGKVLTWNESAERIFGWKEKDVIGRPLPIVPEDMEEEFEELRRQVMIGEGFSRRELIRRRKDGSPVFVSLSYSPVCNEKGIKISIMGAAEDITDRKRAEAKIKEYSENLERMVEERTGELGRALEEMEEDRDKIDSIVKSIADCLIVTDNHNRVVMMNPAAEALLKGSFEDAVDRPIEEAIADEILRDHLKEVLDRQKKEDSFDFEFPGENGGRSRIMRARTAVIPDRKGGTAGVVTIMTDVTHEREVDRMKTEFVSTAAHELKTPLTSILGFSELLVTRDDLAEDEKKRYLRYINEKSRHLDAIISDILDVSRIESGEGIMVGKEFLDLAGLVMEAVDRFRRGHPGRRFDAELSGDAVIVTGDRERLMQAVENLLGNAVKFSPEDRDISITGEMHGGNYVVSIRDEGIGMTAEQVEHIFGKFYRADSSTTAKEGTGLGMSIVKHIVEAHGGTVSVESEPGKGTTVRFTIPMKPDNG